MIELCPGTYDVDLIARSGQSFRWRQLARIGSGPGAGSWRVPALGGCATLLQHGDRILVDLGAPDVRVVRDGEGKGAAASLGPHGDVRRWLDYLALGPHDAAAHEDALEELARLPDPMPRVVRAYGGLRVLHQDAWETCVSFVISQNNNIARIRRSLAAICGSGLSPLPSSEALLDLLVRGKGAGLGLGYRLPYLMDLCRRWPALSPRLGRKEGYEADFYALCEVDGIGPKVANCICLYGLGHEEVVPRDTWIRKAEERHGIVWHPELGGLQQLMVFEWMRARAS